MPCNAVARAVGYVPVELARELEALGAEAVGKALLTFLRRNFADLGEPRMQLSGGQIRIVQGNYLVLVIDGRIVVNAPYGDLQTVGQIKDAVTDFITGLAGLALQKRVVRAICRAGYRVSKEQRAPNGALVLQVEL